MALRPACVPKRILCALMAAICILALMLPAKQSDAATDNSWVRVLLSGGKRQQLALSALGEYFIYQNGSSFWGGTLTVTLNADGTLTASHSLYGTLYTGTEISLLREHVDVAAGAVVFTDDGVDIRGRSYLGHMHFTVAVDSSTGTKYIRVVNEVPIEQYLYSVLGHEMSNSFPLEALKAQAVAARTYAVCYISSKKTNTPDQYQVDDVSDGAYRGYDPVETRVIQAVDETRGQVLYYGADLLKTFYTASNGGETTTPEIWAMERGVTTSGYQVRTDEFDVLNPSSRMDILPIVYGTGGIASLNASLRSYLCGYVAALYGTTADNVSLTQIKSVSAHDPFAAGTTRDMTRCTFVLDCTVLAAAYTDVSCTFNLSELYGSGGTGAFTVTSLRSYWGRDITDTGGNITGYELIHARYGHGVGLSQRGAQARADAGHTYEQILAFYFPQGTLTEIPIYSPMDPATSHDVADMTLFAEGEINAAGTAMRGGPSTYFGVIATLGAGDDVKIYGQIGAWDYCLAEVNGIMGYISSTAITILKEYPQEAPVVPQDAVMAYGRLTGSGVNLRAQPTTTSASLGKLALNSAVDIYSYNAGWYYVKASGTFGWVYGRYVTVTGYPPLTVTSSVSSGATVEAGTAVVLSCASAGAKIYYTLDGSSPKVESDAVHEYTKPVIIDVTTTVTAYARNPGEAGAIYTFTYNVASLTGDVNGDGVVSLIDAVYVARHITGYIELAPSALVRSDMNADGAVDIADLYAIMRLLAA